MKPILFNTKAWLIWGCLISSISGIAQTTENRYKSRLDVKPKQKTMSQITSSSSYKKMPFSYFQPSHLSLDRNVNYQRAAISQYFTNSLMVQTPKNYATKNEAQVVASTTSVETKVEESFSADDKLFNNDKISIWNIYPNPADDIATIKYNISSQVNEVKITFYNVLGSEIKEEVLDKDASRKEISTKDWGNGIYLYQLSADGRSLVTKKLLVRHQ
ncbi:MULTISPECIES: T9SS type A sorting domain-containing protein [unclassified Arcicella]|uniref:T9SS type A sorting domain-containing protein n=1 Tax=unclassified Arcicella TaxID=2644986 RepID=UPI0028664C73|nr:MULTISPECIES: T9SS type A sorting domain-containing protein [unclassified Arcicella]MDR6560981.1 hypothetical protein [Arcicella sp. BE51]MDR6810865.1 hypothetical protein [Arcicella sp. BE140]MDR6822215.1 hypothetical protein [Arcicella sp. BE139]